METEPMPQRLFITIGFPASNVPVRGARVRAINGYDMPNWQRGPTFSDYVRHLLNDGWTFFGPVSRRTLVFERLTP